MCLLCLCVCAIAIYLCAWNTQVINIPWWTGCSWCWYKTEKRNEKSQAYTRAECVVNCELETRNSCYDFIVDISIRFAVWERPIARYLHSFSHILDDDDDFRLGWFDFIGSVWRTIEKAKVKINVESDLITIHLPFFFSSDRIFWFYWLVSFVWILEWKFMGKLVIKIDDSIICWLMANSPPWSWNIE